MQIDWTDLHHFVTLAREGTLSAAARALAGKRHEMMEVGPVDLHVRIFTMDETGWAIPQIENADHNVS
ncbi:MAG: hypothetical protein ACK495_00145, partial [Bradyrhizobium sp.]